MLASNKYTTALDNVQHNADLTDMFIHEQLAILLVCKNLFWKKTSMRGLIIYQVQFLQWLVGGVGRGVFNGW